MGIPLAGMRESPRPDVKEPGGVFIPFGGRTPPNTIFQERPVMMTGILDIVYSSARLYRDNLLNRYVLFVPVGHEPVEVYHRAENFRHLTGFSYPGDARDFLIRALERRLNADLLVPNHGERVMSMKTRALPLMMNVDRYGSYIIEHPSFPDRTYADVACGNQNRVIGYAGSGLYTPRTILEADLSLAPGRAGIAVILKTEPHSATYTLLTKNKTPRDPDRAEKRRHGIRTTLSRYPQPDRLNGFLDYDF